MAAACLEPTQATLRISTDAPCADASRAEGTLSAVYVGAGHGAVTLESGPSAETHACSAGDVGTLVVYPEEGADHANAVVVGVLGQESPDTCFGFADGTVSDAPACIVARRRVAFVDHKPLTVPVILYAACAGVACPGGTTCQPGATPDAAGRPCVSADVSCDETGTCDVTPPVGSGGAAGQGGSGGEGGSGGGGGEGGGGGAPGWTVTEVFVEPGARQVFGDTGGSTIFVSRHRPSGVEECVAVDALAGGLTTPIGEICRAAPAHERALHVLPLATSTPAVELGDRVITFGPSAFEHAFGGGQLRDVFLRDEDRVYAITGSGVARWDAVAQQTLAIGNAAPVTPSALWVQPAPAPDDDFVVIGGTNLCTGTATGLIFCATPTAYDASGTVLDVWGGGNHAIAITNGEVITFEIKPTPVWRATEGALVFGSVALLRVHVTAAGTVWVAGRENGGGPLFVARGTPLMSGSHLWVNSTFPYPFLPRSLWATETEAWVVLNDGRLLRISAEF